MKIDTWWLCLAVCICVFSFCSHARAESNSAEARRIEGDGAAMLVRQGTLEPPSEAERYAATDRAIERLDVLIARWSQEGFEARSDILRARLDRLVALRNRVRMQDVIEEYKKLLEENVEIPPYALSAVADVYLYLREPETARDLYLKVLEVQPHNFDVEAQLFFAYVECDDYERAYELIDRVRNEQPLWIPLRGSATPLPNPDRHKADLFAAEARLFGGEFEEAAQRLEDISGAAPFDARDQYALGNLYLADGLPRAAREAYEIGKNIGQGGDVDNETGIALADLDLQNFHSNEDEVNDLTRRFPEQLEVQRAERLLDLHNMAELQVLSGYGFPPGGTQTNGQTYNFETILYSPPIDTNWRIFSDELFAHGDEPNGEGNVGYLRNSAGVEYRDGDVTADLSPTDNHYHGVERPGIGGNLNWSLNDEWNVFGGGEYFSRDTPVRALNAGVTANEVKFGAQWRENESRSDRLTATIMPFSDGNTQTSVANNYMRRLYASPHWTVDGLFNLAAAQSTANENRRYYNPSANLLGLIGARATQILYHRYETVYQHALWVMPGAYWEQHFGTDGAISLRYENRLRMNDVFEAGIGVNYLRRPYDGAAENDISLSFDLTRRF